MKTIIILFTFVLVLTGCSTTGNTDPKLSKAERRGYDRALNQAVKQQYWIVQRQQQGDDRNRPKPRTVTVRIPETVTDDGTILKPTTATIRTE